MFEESRAAQSAVGPEIDRLRQREAELLREVRRHIGDRAIFNAPLFKESDTLGVPRTPSQQITCELRSELVQMTASAFPSSLTRDLDFQRTSLTSWDEVNHTSI